MTDRAAQPFAELSPDRVLDCIEALGLTCDGSLFALNSYENRVYQIGTESHGSVVAKFYRPGRWSDAQILEEHAFTAELAAMELPVAAPLPFAGGTLLHHGGMRLAVFPRLAARAASVESADELEWIGRTLGRLHAVGARTAFRQRPRIDARRLGVEARARLLASQYLEGGLHARYEDVSQRVLDRVEEALEWLAPVRLIRLHGDCHLGNVLWNEQGPVFVDLDDCATGPPVQDLWMFVSGSPDERRAQWGRLLDGYRQFNAFDPSEIARVEPLRALRMLHHSAWIADRWTDPAFPRAFPWFTSPRFWEEHISDLWQQLDALGEPLSLDP
jgi:Ser/Thr protein kinase RdoA (MazF antagonist)